MGCFTQEQTEAQRINFPKVTQLIRAEPSDFKMYGWNIVAAAAKSLPSCPTLCDPIDAPPSLGFSRPEQCSEPPFPSPMRESEK